MIHNKTLILCFAMLAAAIANVSAQQAGNRKLVLVTFDGYRWEELFKGADSAKFFEKAKGAKDSAQQVARFWGKSAAERRAKLMPFVWSHIARSGQVYGNRTLDSKVNVKNPYWFSYPGYNEILTGYPDTLINSNDYAPNPNVTLPEYLNKQPAFKGRVAAFTSWAAFNNILNRDRCGFPVNAGYAAFDGSAATERQKAISETQFLLPKTFGNNERPDAVTYFLAKEYLKKEHPKFLQISFIETDAWAHRNEYDDYLLSARNNDQMIRDLWETLQSDPFYKDQTTLFICNDHGRGDNQTDNWTHHNSKTPGSDQVWLMVMGPYTTPRGEVSGGQIYQYQYAETMAALLGVNYESPKPKGPAISPVIN